MQRIRAIHPSAALFVGILIALVLPFGHAVASCSSENADFTGIDLVIYDVEPQPSEPGLPIQQADREFADEVETNGGPFAAILLGAAVLGLALAIFARGRLWGTCCFVAALATAAIAVAVNMDDAYVGCHLAFWLSLAGFLTRLFDAVHRWFLRRSARHEQAFVPPPGCR
jgi:hypothetical protein